MLEFYRKSQQLFAVAKKKKKSTIKDVWQGSNHANIFSFSQQFFLRKSKKNKTKNIELCSTSYILDLNRGKAKVKIIDQEKILQ